MFSNPFNRLSRSIQKPFSVKLPDQKELVFGEEYGTPEFQIAINTKNGLQALRSCQELRICEAYIYKDIDLKGKIDMLKLLDISNFFSQGYPLYRLWAKLNMLFSSQTSINQKSIGKHYEYDDEFYLSFLDKTRVYSHGVFLRDDEALEIGSTRKLDFARDVCEIGSGSRVFDLGAGWGCSIEYFGKLGAHVDGVTLSNHSRNFINNLIKDHQLDHCRISKTDFFNYQAPEKNYYDAIVSLGSLEHLPDYAATLKKCDELLKRGGYAYFDAAASDTKKTVNSTFIDRHIFSGNHRCLDIFGFLQAVENSPFELIFVQNDRHNYYLTLTAWASNLDKHREEISAQWGDELYRKFQLYLWGCSHAMLNNKLQAYRVVLRKK